MIETASVATAVSVIVPVGGESALLPEVIRRLLSLQFGTQKHEVIVVDNSINGIHLAIDLVSRVKTIREKRRGASWARNAGAAVAVGRWLVFCDDDVMVSLDWGNLLMREIVAMPFVSAFAGALRPANLANESLALYRRSLNDTLTNGTGNLLCREDALPTLNTALCAVRADVFQAVGRFHTGLEHLEDTEFTIRMLRFGYQLKAMTKSVGEVYYLPDNFFSYMIRKYHKSRWLFPLLEHVRYPLQVQLPKVRFSLLQSPILFCLDVLLKIISYLGYAVGSVRIKVTSAAQPVPRAQARAAIFFSFTHQGRQFVLAPEHALVWTDETCYLFTHGYRKRTFTSDELRALKAVVAGDIVEAQEYFSTWISTGLFIDRPKNYELVSIL